MARDKDRAWTSQQGKRPEDRQDWRRKGDGGQRKRRGDDGEGWNVGNRPSPRYSQYRYLLRMIATTAILVVLLGSWFFYVVQRHRQVPLYSIVVTDYGAHYADTIVPPNAFAFEDLELFAEMFQRRKGSGITRNVGLVKLAEESCSRRTLLEDIPRNLDKPGGNIFAEPGGPNNDVVMFYISTHGAVNAQGQACLVMTDSDPLDSDTWVPLADVLKSISKVTRFATCKKVVFLDASRMCDNWQMGILGNTFPKRVAEAVATAGDPNLVVFNSAGFGQTAWTEPEKACTAFGRIVADGLAGEASRSSWISRALGFNDITLHELKSYIDEKMLQWSQRERAAFQVPTVHYRDGDPLPDWTVVDDAGKSVGAVDRQRQIDALESTVQQRAKDIGELWQQMDAFANQHPYLTQPLRWAALETRLARLETLMVAGSRYDTDYKQLKATIEGSFNAIADQGGGATPFYRDMDSSNYLASLPLARQVQETPVNPTVLARQRTQWASNQDPQAEQWQEVEYVAAVDIGTHWLESLPTPTRDDMRRVIELADHCRDGSTRDLLELQFLRMLTDDTLPESNLRGPVSAAMNCRFLAERAAAPADPRAIYWIEDAVRQADGMRRQAEDRLLLGGDATELAGAWQQLTAPDRDNSYSQAEDVGNQVAEVLRIRDRIWADIPGLALWRLRDLRKQPAGQAKEYETLLELIRQAHELNVMLVQQEGAWLPTIGDLAKRAFEKLEVLRAKYNSDVNEILSQDTNDADSLRRMAVILAAPLRCNVGESLAANRSESRGAVLRKYVNCLFSHQSAQAPASAAPDYEDEGFRWKHHPLAAILDQAKGMGKQTRSASPLKMEDWEKQESDIRGLMKVTLYKTLGDGIHAAVTSLRGEENDPTRQAHQKLREAESLFRAAAPVAASILQTPPNDDLNPARLTLQIAQMRQFLWQEQRTLNDCYLTGRGTSDRSATFVQLASEGYKNAAESMRKEISRSVPRELQFYEPIERIAESDLKPLLTTRSLAQGLQVEATGIRLKEQDDDLNEASSKEVSHTINVLAAPELPPDGLGFLEFRLDNGVPFEVQDARLNQAEPALRHGFPTQGDPRQFRFTVPRNALVDISNLQLRAYFRGGWNLQPIRIQVPNKGIEIIYPKPDYGTPRITVEGDSTKPALIVFILDCSGSMQDTVTGGEGGTSKMNLACAALGGILNNLHKYQADGQGKYIVGLVLYGHRSNWLNSVEKATDNIEDFHVREGYPKHIHPNSDVETIPGTLVPLNDDSMKLFSREIDGVKPWGVTPLYAALKKAIELISQVRGVEACSKRIIAITDGVNETPATANRQLLVDSGDVLKMADDFPDIRIDIVGFDVQYTEKLSRRMARSDFEAKLKELRVISKRFSAGEYYPASEPGALARELENAVKPAEVAVAYKTPGQPVFQTGSSFPLGETWNHKSWSGQADPCKLTITDPQSGFTTQTEVVLEGGEHLQLVYDGSTLAHRPEHSDKLQQEDPHPNVAGNYYVAGLVPKWVGGELVFRCMVRNRDAKKFSPRPQEVWAEITPVGNDPQTPFVFYDLEFENDTSVPVLRFRTSDWPVAGMAQVKLWFRMGNGDVEFDYDESVEKLTPEQRFSVGISGVEFVVEAARISPRTGLRTYVVWEHYADAEMPAARVQLWPTPTITEHEYRHAERQVRHVFRYAEGANLTVPKLRITARRRICEARGIVAISDDPITITLPPRP